MAQNLIYLAVRQTVSFNSIHCPVCECASALCFEGSRTNTNTARKDSQSVSQGVRQTDNKRTNSFCFPFSDSILHSLLRLLPHTSKRKKKRKGSRIICSSRKKEKIIYPKVTPYNMVQLQKKARKSGKERGMQLQLEKV